MDDKYDGQSLQEAKISGLVYTLWWVTLENVHMDLNKITTKGAATLKTLQTGVSNNDDITSQLTSDTRLL